MSWVMLCYRHYVNVLWQWILLQVVDFNVKIFALWVYTSKFDEVLERFYRMKIYRIDL